jgi:hypothetical protein
MKSTPILNSILGSKTDKFDFGKALKETDISKEDIASLGFSADSKAFENPQLAEDIKQFAKDAGLSLGDANIDALGYMFYHYFEPAIQALYTGREMARIFGTVQMGDWTTSKVVFKHRELTGGFGLYDDWSKPILAGYNYGWDTRDTVRFEFGKEVTKLEEARAAVMRRNADKDKMDAIILQDSILMDETFLFGMGIDGKKIYGLANEPGFTGRKTNLNIDPEADSVTAKQMCDMLNAVKQNLVNDLQGNGDINALPVKIVAPNKWQTAFTVVDTVTGYSAMRWLSENWKNAKLEFSAKFDYLDDNEPEMMVYVEQVPGVGVNSVMCITTSKLRLVGAMPSLKGREECYSSSIAGVMAACPVAIRFYTAA